MEYNFAVVGGGPAGCIAATEAAGDGDVILFEEHERQPVHCAGLISSSGLDALGIKRNGFVLNEIRGARLFSPLGTVVEVKTRDVKAYAVDRSRFDRHLLEMALSKGISYENLRVDEINSKNLVASKRKFTAGKTVLATGTNYDLQKKAKLNYPQEFLFGAQYEMDVECEKDMVELHFVVPSFFAWVIPLEDRARVGLCVKTNPSPHLEAFVRRLEKEGRIKSKKVFDKAFGVIPLYNPRLKTQYGDVNLVGDAAGHVKATTGGGVVMGCTAAKYASSNSYEKLWRRAIGMELALHLSIHRFVSRLSAKNMDYLFKITSDGSRSLEKHGDMDYASKTLSALIKNPRFTLKFLLSTPSFLLDFL